MLKASGRRAAALALTAAVVAGHAWLSERVAHSRIGGGDAERAIQRIESALASSDRQAWLSLIPANADAAAAGFDDAVIYDEVAERRQERTLPTEQLAVADSGAPLAAWAALVERQEY